MMAGHAAGSNNGIGCGMDMGDHQAMKHDSAAHTQQDSMRQAMPADSSAKHSADSSDMGTRPMDNMHKKH